MEAPSFYVVSHERAGTHFTINTLLKNTVGISRQANVGEWFGPYDDPAARFAHVDAACQSIPDASTLIKSHCDADLFLARYPRRPVLWVVRDPRDTLVSWFHYLNREEYYRNNPGVERFTGGTFGDFLAPAAHGLPALLVLAARRLRQRRRTLGRAHAGLGARDVDRVRRALRGTPPRL